MGVSGQKNAAKSQKKPDPRDPYALALAAQGFQGHQCTVHGLSRYSPVTCLHTAVTEGCIDARQLFCEKASNINGLRDFLNFFRIFGARVGLRGQDAVKLIRSPSLACLSFQHPEAWTIDP
jgi:hypothetical protein